MTLANLLIPKGKYFNFSKTCVEKGEMLLLEFTVGKKGMIKNDSEALYHAAYVKRTKRSCARNIPTDRLLIPLSNISKGFEL